MNATGQLSVVGCQLLNASDRAVQFDSQTETLLPLQLTTHDGAWAPARSREQRAPGASRDQLTTDDGLRTPGGSRGYVTFVDPQPDEGGERLCADRSIPGADAAGLYDAAPSGLFGRSLALYPCGDGVTV